MNAPIASAFILLSLGTTIATAQQPVLNDRVAKSMQGMQLVRTAPGIAA